MSTERWYTEITKRNALVVGIISILICMVISIASSYLIITFIKNKILSFVLLLLSGCVASLFLEIFTCMMTAIYMQNIYSK